MSVLKDLLNFDPPEAPVIHKKGLRYIWQENVQIDDDTILKVKNGLVDCTRIDEQGRLSTQFFKNSIVGDPFFPFEDYMDDLPKDTEDLESTIGIYALEGTF